MESQENPQSPKEKYIQLEEAEYLVQGQNFFDQQPFKSVIQTVSEETKTDPMKLCWLVNSMVGPATFYDGPKSAWLNLQGHLLVEIENINQLTDIDQKRKK